MNRTLKRWLTAIGATVALAATSVTAFAADEGTASAAPSGTSTPTGGILYYVIMIAVFLLVGYFFLIRPEKKRKKDAETLKDSLKAGDRITTIGGIVGTVESITDEEIYLTNGLVLKRWALRSIDQAENSSSVTYYDDDEEASKETSEDKKED